MSASIEVVKSTPRAVEVIGVPVFASGPVARQLAMTRTVLSGHGFDGKAGQSLVLPSATGPTLIAIGLGDAAKIDVQGLRNAAACLVRAAGKRFADYVREVSPTKVQNLEGLPGL